MFFYHFRFCHSSSFVSRSSTFNGKEFFKLKYHTYHNIMVNNNPKTTALCLGGLPITQQVAQKPGIYFTWRFKRLEVPLCLTCCTNLALPEICCFHMQRLMKDLRNLLAIHKIYLKALFADINLTSLLHILFWILRKYVCWCQQTPK